jgi:hypothetical protein
MKILLRTIEDGQQIDNEMSLEDLAKLLAPHIAKEFAKRARVMGAQHI